MKFRIYLLILLTFSYLANYAIQDEGQVDSLNNAINNALHDSTKVELLLELAEFYSITDFSKSKEIITEAIEISEKNLNYQSLAVEYKLFASHCYNNKKKEKSIEYYKKSLFYYGKTNGNELIEISIIRKISELYEELEDYKSANYYNKLQINKIDSINKISEQQTTDFTKNKLEEQTAKYEIARIEKDKYIKKQILWKNIAIITGLFTFLVSLLIYRSYRQKKKSTKLLENQNLAILQQKSNIQRQADDLEKLSIVAEKTENSVLIMDAAGNFKWANDGFKRIYGYSCHEYSSKFGGSIYDVSTNNNVKNAVDLCRKNKQSVVYESFIPNNGKPKTWLQTTLTPILNRNNEIEKLIAVETDISKLKNAEEEIASQRDMLKFQNEQITDSIEYAKTIQNAMLPDIDYISSFYPIFLIYRPKDIVSGDFYWFSNIDLPYFSYNFFAVVDCTGHGVPGAFMSMIGNRLLNEIINEKNIFKPAAILEELDKRVVNALRKKQTVLDDGMDVSICRIEKQKNDNKDVNISFSGAKRPLYYFSSMENKIEIIKGSKRTIGGLYTSRDTIPYEENVIKLMNGDKIYMFTDGYTDQNAPNRKRLGRKRLHDTLENIAYLPVVEQQHFIEQILDDWQQNSKQRDDITFMGIEV